jgi:hypothetical protein
MNDQHLANHGANPPRIEVLPFVSTQRLVVRLVGKERRNVFPATEPEFEDRIDLGRDIALEGRLAQLGKLPKDESSQHDHAAIMT